jgi:acyl-CoA dehydrogenase
VALDRETREEMLNTLRRFVAERMRPFEREVSESDTIPDDLVYEMRQLGLFGLSIPELYGGLGLSMEDECLAVIELGKVSPAFRSVFGTNVGIGSQGIVMFGSEAQKTEWLPKIASGEVITSFALTEPEAGSDAASLRTSAKRNGSVYVLNGSKRYITNAGRASLFTVMARTDPNRPGAAGISAFLVPSDTPGLSVGKSEKKMGQQGAHIHDVVFDNVCVPVANRLGEEGAGFNVAMRVLDKGRLHIAALSIGAAERLIKDCVDYALERKQFGKSIASFQLVQAMIADSKTEAYAARTMTLESARRYDAQQTITLEAAASKYFASEMVGRVADRAVQIFGGAGYVEEHGIARMYRDVRVFRIYEGSSQIQQLIIARETLKQGG